MIPDDPRKPMDPSGVRIGVPAITTRGMKEKEIKIIANWINQAVENHNDKKLLEKLGAQVMEGAAIVDLPELGGSDKLRAGGLSLFTLVDFSGH